MFPGLFHSLISFLYDRQALAPDRETSVLCGDRPNGHVPPVGHQREIQPPEPAVFGEEPFDIRKVAGREPGLPRGMAVDQPAERDALLRPRFDPRVQKRRIGDVNGAVRDRRGEIVDVRADGPVPHPERPAPLRRRGRVSRQHIPVRLFGHDHGSPPPFFNYRAAGPGAARGPYPLPSLNDRQPCLSLGK